MPGLDRWGSMAMSGFGILLLFEDHSMIRQFGFLTAKLTLGDQKEMLLDDRVLIELYTTRITDSEIPQSDTH